MVREPKTAQETLSGKRRSRRYDISRTFAFNAEAWAKFAAYLSARAMEPAGFMRAAVEQCSSGQFVSLQTVPPEIVAAVDEVRIRFGFSSFQPALEIILREWWNAQQPANTTAKQRPGGDNE